MFNVRNEIEGRPLQTVGVCARVPSSPVEEVIRDGENGWLVDFFSPAQIADRVIAALEAPEHSATIRMNARQTVIDRYDLRSVCLPAQLLLVNRVAGRR